MGNVDGEGRKGMERRWKGWKHGLHYLEFSDSRIGKTKMNITI